MANPQNGVPCLGDFIMMLCQAGSIDNMPEAFGAFEQLLPVPLGDFQSEYDIILYQDANGNHFVALEYNVEGLTELARYKATPIRRE